MAKGTFHRRSTTALSAKKKDSESRSFGFKKSVYAVAAAALIVAVGVGLWRQELLNKPVKAEMPAMEKLLLNDGIKSHLSKKVPPSAWV